MSLVVAGALAVVSAGVCRAGEVSPRQLLEVADILGPTVSPDGRRVAFRVERASVERNTYDTVWYVQGLDEPLPRRVGEGGVVLRDSAGGTLPPKVVWLPDGRWIFFRARVEGRVDVWRAAADGSGAAPVTRDKADVRDFELAEDGRALKYSVGPTREAVARAEQAEYDAGVLIDDSIPVGQGLFRSGTVDGRLATQRFGAVWFDRMPLLGEEPDRWMRTDLATGETRALAPAEVPSNAAEVQADDVEGELWQSAREPGGDRVAVLMRVGEEPGQMFAPEVRMSVLAGGRGRPVAECTAELCTGQSITRIHWRPGSDEVAFVITDSQRGLAQSLRLWNVSTGAVREVVQARGLLSGGRSAAQECGVSAGAWVCVAAEADRPPRLERIDLDTGTRHVLFEPNLALAQDMAQGAPARLLRWEDARGRRFSGHLFPARVAGDGPAPLFITYYNCAGFLRGGVGDEWPLASLAQAGISALCINRLPGFTMDAVERHGEGTAAAVSVVDHLAAAGEIDRARVGMGGLSFGGGVTLWTATEADLLAAASVANPVATPLYYLLGSMREGVFLDTLYEMWGLGAPEDTPERWRELSPVFKLDRIRAPILFQHSEQEYMYALEYIVPLLREKRAELYVFPHEPHQKFQPRHKLAVYERNLDWFRFWLQGHEDDAPGKQAQYERWREMREAMALEVP